ncbi:MAG: hypothetical protein IJ033_01225 [Clostridia bacterium]|nr:hypothetical protein [Clostridia bacterium]
MAKKSKKLNLKFNKTTLFILIAIVVIVGLLVALAYSPVGASLLGNLDDGSQDGTSGTPKRIIKLGGNAVDASSNVILENVVCQIHFIDVGQGDAILVQFSDGTDVLIDGGSTSSGLADIRTSYVNYLMGAGIVDEIDYMIVTHPDTDHYNMLTAVMDSFVVECVMLNNTAKNQTYGTFIDRVHEEVSGTNFIGLDGDGEVYDNVISGVGYSFDIYAPGYDRFQDDNEEFDAYESNGMSPIILLEVANRKVLFTGDATYETEEWFVSYLGENACDVDVLKVAHHGSDSSNTEAFLDKINAEFAVISSDDGTKHGHPTPIVMNRLFDRGIVTYRTNRHGDIVLSIDESGDFAYEVEKEVMVENNTNNVNDRMIVTE